MNKVTTIRLGNYVITIDEDAAAAVAQYSEKLKRRYATEEGAADIISDIENRMGELLMQKQTAQRRSFNTLEDVQSVIIQMGPVDATEGETEFGTSGEGPRRLFRNPDDRIVAGVWGGVGAYFDIDPILLRVGWVVSLLAFGFGIPLYVILWIVIPEARTTAEKLMMRGRKPTLQNIEENLRAEFTEVGQRFKSPGVQTRLGDFLRTLIVYMARFFEVVLRIAFSIAAFCLLTVLIAVLFGVTTNSIYIHDFHWVINGKEGLNVLLSAAGDPFWIKIAVVTFLLLAMSYVGLMVFTNRQNRARTRIPRRALAWASTVAFLILFVLAFNGIRSVSHRSEKTVYRETLQVTGDTLTLDAAMVNTEEPGFYTLNAFADILPSADGDWHLEQKNMSHGRSHWSGVVRSETMPKMYTLSPNHLNLQQGTKVQDIQKNGLNWVRYTLYVPKGKTVKTGSHFHFPENNRTELSGQNQTYTMDSTGVVMGALATAHSTELTGGLSYLKVSGKFDIQIIPSDKEFVQLVSGPVLDHSEWVNWNNGTLELEDEGDDWFTERPSYIKVYTKKLRRVEVSRTGRIDFKHWKSDAFELKLTGAASAEGELDLSAFSLDINGASVAELAGNTETLSLDVGGASNFKGESMQCQTAEVDCSGASKSALWVLTKVEGQCTGASNLRVKGNPAQSEIQVSGASRYQKL